MGGPLHSTTHGRGWGGGARGMLSPALHCLILGLLLGNVPVHAAPPPPPPPPPTPTETLSKTSTTTQTVTQSTTSKKATPTETVTVVLVPGEQVTPVMSTATKELSVTRVVTPVIAVDPPVNYIAVFPPELETESGESLHNTMIIVGLVCGAAAVIVCILFAVFWRFGDKAKKKTAAAIEEQSKELEEKQKRVEALVDNARERVNNNEKTMMEGLQRQQDQIEKVKRDFGDNRVLNDKVTMTLENCRRLERYLKDLKEVQDQTMNLLDDVQKKAEHNEELVRELETLKTQKAEQEALASAEVPQSTFFNGAPHANGNGTADNHRSTYTPPTLDYGLGEAVPVVLQRASLGLDSYRMGSDKGQDSHPLLRSSSPLQKGSPLAEAVRSQQFPPRITNGYQQQVNPDVAKRQISYYVYKKVNIEIVVDGSECSLQLSSSRKKKDIVESVPLKQIVKVGEEPSTQGLSGMKIAFYVQTMTKKLVLIATSNAERSAWLQWFRTNLPYATDSLTKKSVLTGSPHRPLGVPTL